VKKLMSITMLAVITATAQAQAPAQVVGRNLGKGENLSDGDLKEIGNGPAGVSQLFWENQHDIQEEILDGLSEISVGANVEQNIIDKVSAGVWVDLEPRHRVYRINTGNIEEGRPESTAESYYLVVDQLKSQIRASLHYEDVVGETNVGLSPVGFEGAEVLRKLTPVRSLEAYKKNVNRTTEQYFEKFKDNSPDQANVAGAVKDGLRWTYGAVATAYDKMEDLFRNTSQLVADEDSTKIFFVVPFNGVRTKTRIYEVQHENYLANVDHGETLDLVRYFKTGFVNVGVGIADWRMTYSPRLINVLSQRSARRATNAECSVETNNCQEVILSMRYSINKGNEVGIAYRPGIGPFSVKLVRGNRHKTTFREIEKLYRLDLSKKAGQEAFDLFFSDFKPSYTEWDKLPTINEGDAAKLLRVYYRGKNANGKRTKDDEDVINVSSDGRIELGVYSRKLKNNFAEYPMCISDVFNGQQTNRRCNFSATSTRDSRYANRIKWVKDNEANYVGMVGLSNAEIEDHKDGSEKTTNLHFAIRYNDRNAEDYNSVAEKTKKIFYEDYYDKLANIRTALAVDQLGELYAANNGFGDIKSRADILRDKYRKIEHSLQNMTLDIYMDGEFTKTILERTPEEVEAAVNSMKISAKTRADLLKAFKDTRGQPGEKQVKTLVRLYNQKGRKPYFAGLMMLLGKNHVEHANAGHLAIRFRSEASDFSDSEKYKEIIVGTGIKRLEKKIFVARNEFADPEPGVARLSQIKIFAKRSTIGSNNPCLYLNFLANIKSTSSGGTMNLVGKLSKFKLFAADEKLADIKVTGLTPYEKIDGNYRFIVEFCNGSSLNLNQKTDYTIQFQLEDPGVSEALPSKRLTETREAAFSIN
jgi:hypothetical protein